MLGPRSFLAWACPRDWGGGRVCSEGWVYQRAGHIPERWGYQRGWAYQRAGGGVGMYTHPP